MSFEDEYNVDFSNWLKRVNSDDLEASLIRFQIALGTKNNEEFTKALRYLVRRPKIRLSRIDDCKRKLSSETKEDEYQSQLDQLPKRIKNEQEKRTSEVIEEDKALYSQAQNIICLITPDSSQPSSPVSISKLNYIQADIPVLLDSDKKSNGSFSNVVLNTAVNSEASASISRKSFEITVPIRSENIFSEHINSTVNDENIKVSLNLPDGDAAFKKNISCITRFRKNNSPEAQSQGYKEKTSSEEQNMNQESQMLCNQNTTKTPSLVYKNIIQEDKVKTTERNKISSRESIHNLLNQLDVTLLNQSRSKTPKPFVKENSILSASDLSNPTEGINLESIFSETETSTLKTMNNNFNNVNAIVPSQQKITVTDKVKSTLENPFNPKDCNIKDIPKEAESITVAPVALSDFIILNQPLKKNLGKSSHLSLATSSKCRISFDDTNKPKHKLSLGPSQSSKQKNRSVLTKAPQLCKTNILDKAHNKNILLGNTSFKKLQKSMSETGEDFLVKPIQSQVIQESMPLTIAQNHGIFQPEKPRAEDIIAFMNTTVPISTTVIFDSDDESDDNCSNVQNQTASSNDTDNLSAKKNIDSSDNIVEKTIFANSATIVERNDQQVGRNTNDSKFHKPPTEPFVTKNNNTSTSVLSELLKIPDEQTTYKTLKMQNTPKDLACGVKMNLTLNENESINKNCTNTLLSQNYFTKFESSTNNGSSALNKNTTENITINKDNLKCAQLNSNPNTVHKISDQFKLPNSNPAITKENGNKEVRSNDFETRVQYEELQRKRDIFIKNYLNETFSDSVERENCNAGTFKNVLSKGNLDMKDLNMVMSNQTPKVNISLNKSNPLYSEYNLLVGSVILLIKEEIAFKIRKQREAPNRLPPNARTLLEDRQYVQRKVHIYEICKPLYKSDFLNNFKHEIFFKSIIYQIFKICQSQNMGVISLETVFGVLNKFLKYYDVEDKFTTYQPFTSQSEYVSSGNNHRPGAFANVSGNAHETENDWISNQLEAQLAANRVLNTENNQNRNVFIINQNIKGDVKINSSGLISQGRVKTPPSSLCLEHQLCVNKINDLRKPPPSYASSIAPPPANIQYKTMPKFEAHVRSKGSRVKITPSVNYYRQTSNCNFEVFHNQHQAWYNEYILKGQASSIASNQAPNVTHTTNLNLENQAFFNEKFLRSPPLSVEAHQKPNVQRKTSTNIQSRAWVDKNILKGNSSVANDQTPNVSRKAKYNVQNQALLNENMSKCSSGVTPQLKPYGPNATSSNLLNQAWLDQDVRRGSSNVTNYHTSNSLRTTTSNLQKQARHSESMSKASLSTAAYQIQNVPNTISSNLQNQSWPDEDTLKSRTSVTAYQTPNAPSTTSLNIQNQDWLNENVLKKGFSSVSTHQTPNVPCTTSFNLQHQNRHHEISRRSLSNAAVHQTPNVLGTTSSNPQENSKTYPSVINYIGSQSSSFAARLSSNNFQTGEPGFQDQDPFLRRF